MKKEIKFVDTNILLHCLEKLKSEECFFISAVTLRELEDIKTNRHKTEEVKFQARQATRYLNEHQGKVKIIIDNYEKSLKMFKIDLPDTPDHRIIQCAKFAQDKCLDDDEQLIFVSNDLLARLLAEQYYDLPTSSMYESHDDLYKGYISAQLDSGKMAYMYEHLGENQFDMLVNQYLLVKDETGKIVDVLKWTSNGLETVRQKSLKSQMFGTLKPLDEIQRCAMDSLMNNDITVLYGKAGSGKTTLPLNYIMQMLEKGTYKKCYIVYSYEPLRGAKTLGYEKGDHVTKLLYSASLGNILSSKFGDMQQVEYLLGRGMIEIIPTANIRGVQINKNEICYCTETQNLDVYTLKTIVQRCEDGCKQIYEGDIIEQKDTNISNVGINRLIDVFKGHDKFGCIKLKNNYRGELSELADRM